jgi:hypothetical protein
LPKGFPFLQLTFHDRRLEGVKDDVSGRGHCTDVCGVQS